jgi:hypothetical protein
LRTEGDTFISVAPSPRTDSSNSNPFLPDNVALLETENKDASGEGYSVKQNFFFIVTDILA